MLFIQLFNKYKSNVGKADIGHALKLELFCCQMLQETIQLWLDENFDLAQLDPIVGDTACQIRTDKLLQLIPLSNDLRQEMSDMLHKNRIVYEFILKTQQFHGTIKERKSMDMFISQFKDGWMTFIQSNHVPSLVLSDDLQFLILTHIISFYYSANPEDKKLHIQLANRFGFTLGFTTAILDRSRKRLNRMTNDHILAIADNLIKLSDSDEIKQLAMAIEQVEENGPLKSHSTYIGFMLLIKWWWLKQVPLILKSHIRCNNHSHDIHTITLHYSPTRELDSYRLTADLNKFAHTAAIVFQGITYLSGVFHSIDIDEVNKEFSSGSIDISNQECDELYTLKERIAFLDIKEIILCNAALHYQFVDKKKAIDFDRLGNNGSILKNDYFKISSQALQKGLCLKNPSTFRLIHVYPQFITSQQNR